MLPDAIFTHVGTGPEARVGSWATAAWISDYQPSQTFVPEPTTPLLLGLGLTGLPVKRTFHK